MNFSNLVECLKRNGVDVNPSFAKAYQSGGCIEAYRETFDGMVADIGEYAVAAVNSTTGFTGTIRKSIKELSNTIVYISNQTTPTALSEVDNKRAKVRRKMANPLSKITPSDTTMCEEVIQRIQMYKKGVRVQLGRDIAAERKPILQDCLKKLDQLEAELGNVVDVTSPEALEKAKAITDTLVTWANIVAQAMHDNSTPMMLDTAIKSAKKWSEQVVSKKTSLFFGKPKEIDISSVIFDENNRDSYDELTQMAVSAVVIDQVQIFRDNLSDFEALIRRQEDTTELEAELSGVEATLNSLHAQKDALIKRLDNGEISREDAVDEAEDLRDEIDDALDDKERIKAEIADSKESVKAHKGIFKILDNVLKVIEKYKESNPTMVEFISRYLDFNALYHVMKGDFNVEDKNVLVIMKKAEEIVQAERNNKLFDLKAQEEFKTPRRERRARSEREQRQQNPEEQRRQDEALDWLTGDTNRNQNTQAQQPADGQKKDALDDLREIFRP